jgi:hypothetical protein
MLLIYVFLSFIFISKAGDFPGEWNALEILHAKFINTTKQQTENALLATYPGMHLDL